VQNWYFPSAKGVAQATALAGAFGARRRRVRASTGLSRGLAEAEAGARAQHLDALA